MDAGGAAREQLGALERRVGDAELEDGLGVARRATRAPRSSRAGIVAPHMPVIVLICATSVIGMIPGRIGTSMPTARASSTNRKYSSLSKNSWVIRNDAPASTFSLEEVKVVSRGRAPPDGPPGKHAAPTLNG